MDIIIRYRQNADILRYITVEYLVTQYYESQTFDTFWRGLSKNEHKYCWSVQFGAYTQCI